ncbi:N-acetylmuramoyl-L-alanine amidase [Actinophytocola gossypii]|uniref:N-acetylmuramoyl-L-alanine amidase n=1 Tax=Actinophytocola gossypii TaxID=2812003 RepID=A0ABT2J8Y6_9PSEU|nr:peptidoglycan recognition family protein [Actinophytocola gossypii]MCT2584318.1 N-acetylmuramoyl-L-alanine amidase [Actinophytocola gossypii]
MRARTTLGAAALIVGAVIAGLATPAQAGQADPFTAAAAEFDVPRDLIVAVGYGETRLDGHGGAPSQDNGFGVMHLVSNPSRHTLERAARLTGEPVAELRTDTAANVRGGAAVLRAMADEHGLSGADRDRLGAWYPVVASYGGAADDRVARMYADMVYDLLRAGVDARGVTAEARDVLPELGRFASVRALDEGAGALDYPGAIWNPAHSANFAAGRTDTIRTVVVHVTQGSYAGSISWFQDPASQVSAHYVIRSSDGEITQMVHDQDTAWHARSANASSIGIEHEGWIDDPAWFTETMYRSSAALTAWLCDTYGLAKTRDVIVGHSEVPGNDHTDPGPNWDWDHYMSLVNGG